MTAKTRAIRIMQHYGDYKAGTQIEADIADEILAAEEAEREACAKLVEANAPSKEREFSGPFGEAIVKMMLSSVRAVQEALAAAIRARSKARL